MMWRTAGDGMSGPLSGFSRGLLLTLGMFVIFVLVLALYVRSEQRIDRAYERRLQSFMLADELRQSSDDLTRMARSYVVTGDPAYKRHYLEILDIRDGRRPRPVGYENIYWDIVLSGERAPRLEGQAVALLELMRSAGFSEAEFAQLAQAKANSDALTRAEFAAMALVEATSPATQANRLKAIRMLNDAAYHRAKADIMRPISEFYHMMDQRTLDAVAAAKHLSRLVLATLIAVGALLVLAVRRAYRALHETLGCSVDELQRRIAGLGSGDLSTPIQVPPGRDDSVLAWVAETGANLARMETERRQAEAAVLRLNAQLEQRVAQRTAELEAANRELEEFSYSMSHDLRTPLRALDGFSKILIEEHGARLDAEGKRLLQVVRESAQRMGRMIDGILHYLSLGRQHMAWGSIDMNGLASALFAELQAAFPARRLRLELGLLPPAWGDAAMIGEVLRSLLSNAVKFSPADAEALIEVGCSRGKQEDCYYVRDHGAGFDMRFADKLFRVFERVHQTGQYEGSGIGLAIAKRIVTRHGGHIWAEGKVNEGATIYFALPTKEAAHG